MDLPVIASEGPTTATSKDRQASKHLGLKPSDNFLPSFHDGVQFASHHDGQALVLGQGELNVSPSLLHDVHTNFGLISFSKLTVVLVTSLFQRDMKNLGKRNLRSVLLSHMI